MLPGNPDHAAMRTEEPKVPYVGDLIGIPYEFLDRAKDGKAETVDCMGVVLEIYRRAGMEKTDPFAEDADPEAASREWVPVNPDPATWLPLTVLQLTKEGEPDGLANHMAVYLGAGLVIHATEDRGTVAESLLSSGVQLFLP